MIRKISIIFILGIFFSLWYSHACSIIIEDHDSEQEWMNSDLITIASIESFKKIDQQSWDSDYDIIYNFKVQKIFKWDKDIQSFSLQDLTTSSCDSWIYESWTYLLYLRQNPQNSSLYTISSIATLIKPITYPVIPISNPLWNNKRYIAYYNFKQEIFNTRRDIRILVENKRYYLQSKVNDYNITYGFY